MADPYGNLLDGLGIVRDGLAAAHKADSATLVADAIAEIERLRAAVALHRENPAGVVVNVSWCVECQKPWPCPTVTTAEGDDQ